MGYSDRKRILERMAHCHRKHRDRKSAAGKKNWNGRKTKCAGKFCGGEAIWGSGAEPAPFVSAPKAMADLGKNAYFLSEQYV